MNINTSNQEQQMRKNIEHNDEEIADPASVQFEATPKSIEDQENQVEHTPNPKEYLNMKHVYFYVITITLWVMVTVLSIVVGDVSVFFGVLGALAGCYFMFTLPGLFYVIVIHKKNVQLSTAWSKIKYAIAWAYLLIGVFLMVTLTM